MNNDHGKHCLWILLLVALVLTALVASATTLVPMSFESLAQQATAIVRVRCVGAQSVWADGEIWTDTRFAVLQQEKPDAFGADQFEMSSPAAAPGISMRPGTGTRPGAAASVSRFTLRQMGGSIGGVHSHVDDVPQFNPGEEVYLFLWRRAGEPYRVLGWTQGTFRVARDARTRTARVTQDSAASVFHSESREFQSSGIRNLPLAAFEERLHSALSTEVR
jgi:hypothetical protein